MTGASWVAAGCLVAAALAILPASGRNARRRLATLARGDDLAGTGVAGRLALRRPPLWAAVGVATAAAVGATTAVGGPVAGMASAVYCAVAMHILRRRRADRAAAHSRVHALDTLYCLAADLRAGAPAAAISMVDGSGGLAWLVEALRRLADRTGAPLADLLERVAADARATDRIRAVAAAQAAGAQATAWLLAALPAGGIALGYAIGADPLRVLLHTPIGAGCTGGAIVLQIAGLVWADRLIRPAPLDMRVAPTEVQAAPTGAHTVSREMQATPTGVRAAPTGIPAARLTPRSHVETRSARLDAQVAR